MKQPCPIAVVARGGRFPEASDPQALWEAVRDGVCTAREVSPERWVLPPELARATAGSGAVPDRVASTRACFVAEPELDASRLDLPPGLLGRLDPMFRLGLAAAADAWADCAHSEVDPARVDVILGNIALPTETTSALSWEVIGGELERRIFGPASVTPRPRVDRLNRHVVGLPAGLIARALGLGGDVLALDAACASSLFAIGLAVEALQAHRADAVLAGGLGRPDSLYTHMGFSQLRALSPTGRCAPFDVSGDGLLMGEGAGVFVLKRLDDALAQGDRIHGLIRGVGLSNDMDGKLLSPSTEGQLRAMRAAYTQAGFGPTEVDLVECHATGTPVGDATELRSLLKLWEGLESRPGQCVIGSVKSNVGHLLTGAGAAGMMKALLSLEHQTLPPTAGFEQGLPELAGAPFRVLREAEAWEVPRGGGPRRAAVSGFGFGGTNAHVLLEEWRGEDELSTARRRRAAATDAPAGAPGVASGVAPSVTAGPVAVIGIGGSFGPWQEREQLRDQLLRLSEEETAPTPHAWQAAGVDRQGHYLEALEVALGRFRIPPTELREMLPQQLLMLLAAAEALEGAEHSGVSTGAYLGISLDLNTTQYHARWAALAEGEAWGRRLEVEDPAAFASDLADAVSAPLSPDRTMGALGGIVASRIAREFGLGGPCFVLSSEESSALTALSAAVRALQSGQVDRALAGAVDLAGDPRALNTGSEPVGEGAGALLLCRLEDAVASGATIYAVIEGLGSASAAAPLTEGPAAGTLCRAADRAWAEARAENADAVVPGADLVELCRAGPPTDDPDFLARLAGLEVLDAGEPAPFVGLAEGRVGAAGAASGMAGLLRAILALHHRTIPGESEASPAVSWLRDAGSGPRRAVVSAHSVDGKCIQVVLREADASAVALPAGQSLARTLSRETLLLLSADDRGSLAERLRAVAGELSTRSLASVARRAAALEAAAPGTFGLSLLVRDGEEGHRLATLALAILEDASKPAEGLESELALGSRGRIACTFAPLGPSGELAFVYPGSGNHFPGMGRWAALRFPELFEPGDLATREGLGRITEQLRPGLSWRTPLSEMNVDPAGLIRAQVALGIGLTEVVRAFGLSPTHALGYSLGETAALFSLGAWRDRAEMAERMARTELFTDALCGSCDAARTLWGEAGEVRWSMAVVRAAPGKLRELLREETRVYLQIINTPEECVIGGESGALEAFALRHGLELHPIEGVTTVHCEVVKPVAGAYRELHLLPTTPPEGVRFYSGAWGRSYRVEREGAADAILAQALEGIDFPATVESAWQAGARLFLEIGPGSSCTRMISRILAGREHRAIALQVAGQDPERSLLRALAALHAHRVPLSLEPLFEGEEEAPAAAAKPPAAVTRLPVGQPPPEPPRPRATASVPVPSAPPAVPASRPPATAPRASLAGLTPVTEVGVPPVPVTLPLRAPDPMVQALATAAAARAEAHRQFLASSRENLRILSEGFGLLSAGPGLSPRPPASVPAVPPMAAFRPPSTAPRSLELDQCIAFAVGRIGDVLGSQFAHVDAHPTRVRLPEGPLMLVDRIPLIDAEAGSMQPGRVVTEHTVHEGRWYLDAGRIPTGVCVESGQADLFLAGYLGIDTETRGLAVYRLLDAEVSFHRGLPTCGETLQHDIRIRELFQQAGTWFFRFEYDSTVAGEPVLTMRDGLAGFFTAEALAAGDGIKASRLDREGRRKLPPSPHPTLSPPVRGERFDADALEALRRGDLVSAFGPAFAALPLSAPARLPGGKLALIDALTECDETGGWYGRGLIRATKAIHPDDWFLTCHFVDDPVMPGTLMYESALQALRVFLLRKGWVGEESAVVFEPVPGVRSRLKCRGQVIASTREATYEVHLKELSCAADGQPPRAIADVLMYADGRPIVEIVDMSLQATGLAHDALVALWQGEASVSAEAPAADRRDAPTLYGPERIKAYAEGRPSEAFGEPYRLFDEGRRIARLPRDPYLFVDRVTRVKGEPFAFVAGAEVDAEVEVPGSAWYFGDDPSPVMPFAVLLEIALQPCGWLAAYVGSALQSETDLHFRNLGGKASHRAAVDRETGRLFTRTRLTDLSKSGDTIIQHFSFEVSDAKRKVYEGTTYFGFFTGAALKNQVGLRGKVLQELPTTPTLAAFGMDHPALPAGKLKMLDRIDHLSLTGGPHGHGLVQGSKTIDPEEWFFRAHFYQDPVWPGSLGVEAFLQLLRAQGIARWGATQFTPVLGAEQQWSYRGQVIPADREVIVQTVITGVDEEARTLRADGFLQVDGRLIYEMKDFALACEGGA